MKKVIKIVFLGEKVGAIKSGRCPMYAVEDKKNSKDFIESLREDFPDYGFEKGFQEEREALAKFLIRSQKMR